MTMIKIMLGLQLAKNVCRNTIIKFSGDTSMKPNQKKVKPWKPAKVRVIKLPREEPPDTSQLLNEYIGEVQTKEEKPNGERKE